MAAEEDTHNDEAMAQQGPPAALPFGLDKTQLQRGSMQALSTTKLKLFSKGLPTQKSQFQKEKEQKEARLRQQQEEAAQEFAKFAAEFAAGDAGKSSKTFIRGGTVVAGDAVAESAAAARKGAVYRMGSAPDTAQADMEALMREMEERLEDAHRIGGGKKVRQIDLLASEIKAGGNKFSDDDGVTSNLFVTNLALTVNESMLEDRFSEFGPLRSVKIMWPRPGEPRVRPFNSGFVDFLRRQDADAAREELHGKHLQGNALKIGWAKAMPRSAGSSGPAPAPASSKVAAVTAAAAAAPAAASTEPALPPINVQLPDPAVRSLIDAIAPFIAIDGAPLEDALIQQEAHDPKSRMSFLWETDTVAAIYYRWRVMSITMGDSVAKWCVAPFQLTPNGPQWRPPPLTATADAGGGAAARRRSASPKRRGRRSPSRSRSRSRTPDSRSRSPRRNRSRSNSRSPRGRGARRRSFSRSRSRSGSPSRSRSPNRRRRGNKKRDDRRRNGSLRSRESDDFDSMLSKLTIERPRIGRAMLFALDHAEAATQICSMLKAEATRSKISAPRQIAVLYLMSDILHNSSAQVKNASAYRSILEGELPEVFEAMRATLQSIDGRITAETMRKKALAVLQWWDRSSLFPPQYLYGLESTFLRPSDFSDHDEEVGKWDRADLARTCRHAGIAPTGTPTEQLLRLKWAQLQQAKRNEDVYDVDNMDAMAEEPTNDGTDRTPSPEQEPSAPRSKPSTAGWAAVDPEEEKRRRAQEEDTLARIAAEQARVAAEAEAAEAARAAAAAAAAAQAATVSRLAEIAAAAAAAIKRAKAAAQREEGEETEQADVDGEPMDADVDGEPMDDVDGEPMDVDVDGEPMDDVDVYLQ